MILSASLGELDRAWQQRLRLADDFADAVGRDAAGAVRLYRGWPTELLAKPLETALPRVTFFRVDRQPRSTDPECVLIQSDVWASVKQVVSLDAIDAVMMRLLTDGDEGAAAWLDAALGLGVSCSLVDSNDPPDALPRRRSVWKVAPA